MAADDPGSSNAPAVSQETIKRNGRSKTKPQKTLQPDAAAFVPATSANVNAGVNESRKPRNRGRQGRGGGKASEPRFKLTDASQEALANPRARRAVQAIPTPLTGTESIAERIQHALLFNTYECCICVEVIKRHEPVYEDPNCWAVFHLHCITTWAKRALHPAEGRPQETWRCPACQAPSTSLPGEYRCWCTKQMRPEVNKLAPHACGQTCGKQTCPHPCPLPCHPGPCPPCSQMGTAQRCFCGKHVVQKRCLDTDYTLGSWSCQEACDELLPCDKHRCPRPCHPGLCGACLVPEERACRCGKHMKEVRCSDLPEAANWKCLEKCDRLFSCGEHRCEEACHEHTEETPCPRLPDFVKTCPCGQTSLDQLQDAPRTACTDPIPTCAELCPRILSCGHPCDRPCHSGACGVCTRDLAIPCGCGSSQVKASCADVQLGLQPACERVCRAQKSCLRHTCLRRCCTGYAASQKRKGKKARLAAATEMEAEHLCTEPCNRQLSCGQHVCSLLCHRGPCPPCLEATFEELACACGGTVLAPPIACGTLPPVCALPCTRPTSCGHPRIPHNCHADEIACPRCPYLVEKPCQCGKARVKHQPCWQQTVLCGQVCDKLLSCGHQCKVRCHLGDCGPCTQVCGHEKVCGHPCTAPCHAPKPCPDVPCATQVTATCVCGHIKLLVRCGTSTTLACTDVCAAVARSKKLAEALGVDKTATPRPTGPVEYPAALLAYYKDNKIWCTTIETTLRAFCEDAQAKAKLFKPMRVELRQFVHELAEVYGLRSESLDEEPHRAVQVSKTSGTFMPLTKLAQAVPVTLSALEQLKRPSQAYNAFVLLTLQFGLTESALEDALKLDSKLRFDIQFTTDGEHAYLLPTDASKAGLSTEEVEAELLRIKPRLRQCVTKGELAGLCEMCWLNKDGVMSYREGSRKKNVARPAAAVTETRNAFDALAME